MLDKIFNYILIGRLIFASGNVSAFAETTVSLEKTQDPELELSLSKDVFKTSIPAIYNVALSSTKNPRAAIPVKIELTKPFLFDGATDDPKGTKLKAYVSFTDSLGKEKILSSDKGITTAILKPGITKLTLTMEADRPREYFGGSYEYNFTLTVKPVEAP